MEKVSSTNAERRGSNPRQTLGLPIPLKSLSRACSIEHFLDHHKLGELVPGAAIPGLQQNCPSSLSLTSRHEETRTGQHSTRQP